MGGCFSESVYKGTYKQALKEFNADCEQSRHEDGHSYSGGMGMFPGVQKLSKEFNSEDEARDWIEEHHSKWDSAFAVQFKNGRETDASQKKRKALYEATVNGERDVRSLISRFSEEIKQQKSRTKSCKRCGSGVNKSYINNSVCPVCGESMLSETQKKRIANLEKKSQDAQIKRNSFKAKYTSGKLMWMFAGWVSS